MPSHADVPYQHAPRQTVGSAYSAAARQPVSDTITADEAGSDRASVRWPSTTVETMGEATVRGGC